MQTIHALAATSAGGTLQPFEIELGDLPSESVEIAVTHCGICHSDLSMIQNEWGLSTYPLVPGHEIIGSVVAVGDHVKNVQVGQTVGLGWFSESCMGCSSCLSGDHNMCASVEQTIVGRFGGFAERVRCHWSWATPLPAGIDPAKAGPLFCGGITVFNPIIQLGIKPTDRVGVVGIGGLGHLALQFLNKWGCEVFAFSSNENKTEELLRLGAHHVVNSRDPNQLKPLANSLDAILVTVNVPLDWNAYIGSLAPRGRLHFVGAVLEPLNIGAFPLIMAQRSVSGSPLGSPATTAKMLDFCSRHHIEPVVESFPMSRANEAIEHLVSGNARYRVVLTNDWS